MGNVRLTINVVYGEESFEINAVEGEYRSLMALISDNIDVDGFGECGGMGRCATCMAEITFSEGQLPRSDRNEYTTLSKYGINEPSIRLTCQLNVDETINNIQLTLLGS